LASRLGRCKITSAKSKKLREICHKHVKHFVNEKWKRRRDKDVFSKSSKLEHERDLGKAIRKEKMGFSPEVRMEIKQVRELYHPNLYALLVLVMKHLIFAF